MAGAAKSIALHALLIDGTGYPAGAADSELNPDRVETSGGELAPCTWGC